MTIKLMISRHREQLNKLVPLSLQFGEHNYIVKGLNPGAISKVG